MVSILDQLRSEDIFSVVEFSSEVKVSIINATYSLTSHSYILKNRNGIC